MKLLCFGDSLTKGQVGASFIRLLRKDYPGSIFVNRGTNGDTLNIISKKLLQHLQTKSDYDFLLLQGGANDLLLPVFKARGGLFAFAYKQQIKKGLRAATSPLVFYAALKRLFQQIRRHYKGPVIFLTLTTLNENSNTALNRQRRQFNQMIRKAAAEEGILLADIEAPFDALLQKRQQADYLIENFWAVTIADRFISLFKSGPAWLSKRRKLHLTVDGAHINDTGAAIIRACIKQVIEKEQFANVSGAPKNAVLLL